MTWTATLPLERAAEHGGWARTALTLGERFGVYLTPSIPEIGYSRVAHGDLAGFLRAEPGARIDLTHLDDDPDDAESLVAFHGADGNVVEGYVNDLATLLGPARHARSHGHPPLRLYGDSEPIDDLPPDVWVEFHNDLWLPWTSESDPNSPTWEYGDNRTLARRHTPRLNAFLAALRDATLRIGGGWWLESAPDTSSFQIDEHGVLLDGMPPGVS